MQNQPASARLPFEPFNVATLPQQLALLKQARAYIESPDNWTKGAFWRNAEGEVCDLSYSCKFCIIGAAMKAREDLGLSTLDTRYNARLQDALDSKLGAFEVEALVPEWNDLDETSHADVMDLFDRVIRTLEAEILSADGV